MTHNSSHNHTPLRLDIACGKTKKQGFTGVDIWEGADIVMDLEKFPWAFDDNSVDEIFCSHYIEHTPDLVAFANELYRIMKVGATAEIWAPYYSSIRAWQDPTHLRAISENTFYYFNKKWRILKLLDHYPITTDFDFKFRYELEPEWQNKDEKEIKFALTHYINVVSDIHVMLTKRKACSDDVVFLTLQASDCWANGKFEEAVEFGSQLVARGEANSEIYLMLAEHAFKIEDYCQSKDLFQKALEDDEGPFQAHVGILRSFYKLGQQADAKRYITNIRERDQELAEFIEGIVNTDASYFSNEQDGKKNITNGFDPKKILNVGGNRKAFAIPNCFDGWRHDLLDIDPVGNPDILCDARELGKQTSRQYDAIYCSHNLEHYFLHEVPKVLNGFNVQLKQDGFVFIRVPDVSYILSIVYEKKLELDDTLYSAQAHPITVSDVLWGFGRQMEQTGEEFYAHKAGFSNNLLLKLLLAGGFKTVYIKCDNDYFEIIAIAFKGEPDQNMLAYIESSSGFIRHNG